MNLPVYPKNDIWIFDTELDVWIEILPKQTSKPVLFRARLSHTASVYKDQIIIFGGMISRSENSDEILILNLFSKQDLLLNNQFDNLQICPVCEHIYNLDQAKALVEKQLNQAKQKCLADQPDMGEMSLESTLQAKSEERAESMADQSNIQPRKQQLAT